MCAAACVFLVWLSISIAGVAGIAPVSAEETAPTHPADDPTPPAGTVKLIFIHHSTGENWLADWDGWLGNLRVRPEQCFGGGCGESWAYEYVLDSAGMWDLGAVGTWTLSTSEDSAKPSEADSTGP